MAERATVARITGVRFSPSALRLVIRFGGNIKNKKENMNILFICKYNAFRSRIAEENFRKINRNPKIKTASRGIIMGGNSDADQRGIAKNLLGVNIAKRKPMPVNLQELIKADLIVVVADDISKIIFNYQNVPLQKKIVIWNIRDEQKRNKENIKKIALLIKEKVEELNIKLEKKKK